jgi:acyl transferase domain-containing protein
MDSKHAAPQTPLAIVGMACLIPKADGLGAYWANIRHGVDGITEVPSSHWNPDDYFDADPKKPDHTYGRRGGFLSAVDFNPAEFGMAPTPSRPPTPRSCSAWWSPSRR